VVVEYAKVIVDARDRLSKDNKLVEASDGRKYYFHLEDWIGIAFELDV